MRQMQQDVRQDGTAQPAVPPKRLANAIRALAMDAVQAANSGHPGMPMGMADIAAVLWTRHLKHNPLNPQWADRDRFVLSNGHGSMLLYAVLHLSGYDLPIGELRNFRQLHSKTPGHPEVGVTPGVETTTGPLGQGFANAVGLALAERLLAGEFNRDGHHVVDHLTWVFAGDGCLMEGISHEAASLAGTWKLSRMIVLFDDNGISIDGQVPNWCADDVPGRFEAYGWNVIRAVDGHDAAALDAAMAQAALWAREGRTLADGSVKFAPTLVACKTQIGFGSPARANTAKAHGEPLGDAEIAATRAAIGWEAGPFEIPADVGAAWNQQARGQAAEQAWQQRYDAYRAAYPELAAELERRLRGDLPGNWSELAAAALQAAQDKAETVATRKASQLALEAFGPAVAELLGGSADLTGSNLTQFKNAANVRAGDAGPNVGRHINWGVREFGMAAAMNGVALHGGYIPYGGTFLTFSDYSRNAIRMAALMRTRVVHVLTHDSIGLGEDGPTHQSVEHVSSLRLIPGLNVWRPCDTVETTAAWISAIERRDGPSALALSRQNVAFQPRDAKALADVARGGYVLRECVASDGSAAKIAILASGSEVPLAAQAAERLAAEGVSVRVVSMPSTSVFDQQDITYKRDVLPDNLPRIAVEAGVTDFWWKYRCDAVIGLDRYGESAPAGKLFEFFGITVDNLVSTAKSVLAQRG